MRRKFLGQKQQIVLAEGAKFDKVGEFVVGDIGFIVRADEFFWRI